MLGLLVAWQVLIGEEVLLLTAIGLAVGATVLLAHGRVDLRRLLPGLGIGAGVCLVVVAVPLWWQFAGPQSYASICHPPAGNDLAQLWGRATRSIGADPWASAALSMNRTEENSFFGIPLLLAALGRHRRAVAPRARARPRRRRRRLAAGSRSVRRSTLNGVVDRHPRARGRCSSSVPVLENVLPTRFALVAVPALGALLALGTEEVRAGSRAGMPGTPARVSPSRARPPCLVLLPVLPTPLIVDPRAPMPAFFSDGTWRDWVDEGGSVLAAPAPVGR